MKNLKLKPQEIPLSNSNSRYMFSTNADKPFVATTAAIKRFGLSAICVDEPERASVRLMISPRTGR